VADEDDGKPPNLKLVSENPNARTDRQVAWAKEELERSLSQFAAALLRTMAGSDTEATYLMRRLSDFIDAISRFREASGQGLRTAELQEILRLPQQAYDPSDDDWRRRRWLREDGMETIVKGALRLAAHKILGEEPHFGGKHSENVIEQGIKTLEELKQPPRPERKKSLAARDDIDFGPSKSPVGVSAKTRGKRQSFNHEDLKELRKAIKAKDEKRIAELTAKMGKPASDR
jgi:hypothetical protein